MEIRRILQLSDKILFPKHTLPFTLLELCVIKPYAGKFLDSRHHWSYMGWRDRDKWYFTLTCTSFLLSRITHTAEPLTFSLTSKHTYSLVGTSVCTSLIHWLPTLHDTNKTHSLSSVPLIWGRKDWDWRAISRPCVQWILNEQLFARSTSRIIYSQTDRLV